MKSNVGKKGNMPKWLWPVMALVGGYIVGRAVSKSKQKRLNSGK